MPVNYDRAVSRASVFDRARNRDFEFDGMFSVPYNLIQNSKILFEPILS